MAKSKYEKYLIKEPKLMIPARQASVEVKGRLWPPRVYMGKELIPECPIFMEINWVYEVPHPNPHNLGHSHNHDEVIAFVGSDPGNPEYLGAEIEFVMGDEKLIIDKTSAVFVPKGLTHAPVTWKRVDKPVMQLGIVIGGEYD